MEEDELLDLATLTVIIIAMVGFVGLCTYFAGGSSSAAAVDTPSYRVQQHTRHKSAETVARFIRGADKWTKNGLKGVGF